MRMHHVLRRANSGAAKGRPAAATPALPFPRRAAALFYSFVSRLTLVQRFALVSLAILIVGAFIIGSYVAQEIESRVITRTSAISSLYVESFVSPVLQDMGHGVASPQARGELDRLLTDSVLGQEIVSFKVWDAEGGIVYARDPSLIGRRYEREGGLASALAGEVQAEISDLAKEENWLERLHWGQLLEIYAPIRQDETGVILGAMEFYQDPSDLESEIGSSQRKGWIIVGLSTAGMYLLLVGLVKGASNTLVGQHRNLRQLAHQNARLAERMREVAARKTETDEQWLMRIAHELHDGPAQDLGLALLRIKTVRQRARAHLATAPGQTKQLDQDFDLMERALAEALKELREISSGLRLPELAKLTVAEVAEKARLDHERRTGSGVALDRGPIPAAASLPLKIAVYRVLQEALNNAYRHAGGRGQRLRVSYAHGWLELQVSDAGPGFDLEEEVRDGLFGRGLGMRGMRERIEMLGGTLHVASRLGQGTTVTARLPLESEGG